MRQPFAINGLGRIGRALLRASRSHPRLELAAVNDLAPAEGLARLVARDSVYGPFEGTVSAEEGHLVLDGRPVPVFAEEDPAAIPWQESGARLVVEATGAFRRAAPARAHLHGPVDKVVLAWNPEEEPDAGEGGADVTLCMGINQDAYDPARHHVISNASCTTNCIAPLALVLDRAFGLRRGLVNTVHGYTASQALLDSYRADPRRARAAALNAVPTPSRAARAVGAVLPRLAGRLDGFAVRVPTPVVAMLDLVAELEKPAEPEAVRDRLREAAAGDLAGILGVVEEELVSSDFVGDPRSAVADLPLVQQVGGHLVRVVAWYDNEWGYANRLAELLCLIGEKA